MHLHKKVIGLVRDLKKRKNINQSSREQSVLTIKQHNGYTLNRLCFCASVLYHCKFNIFVLSEHLEGIASDWNIMMVFLYNLLIFYRIMIYQLIKIGPAD